MALRRLLIQELGEHSAAVCDHLSKEPRPAPPSKVLVECVGSVADLLTYVVRRRPEAKSIRCRSIRHLRHVMGCAFNDHGRPFLEGVLRCHGFGADVNKKSNLQVKIM